MNQKRTAAKQIKWPSVAEVSEPEKPSDVKNQPKQISRKTAGEVEKLLRRARGINAEMNEIEDRVADLLGVAEGLRDDTDSSPTGFISDSLRSPGIRVLLKALNIVVKD